MLYKLTRKELKKVGASDFKDKDFISVSKYWIHIRYTDGQKKYGTPALLSMVENIETCKFLDCTPGVGWPYYIDEFIHK